MNNNQLAIKPKTTKRHNMKNEIIKIRKVAVNYSTNVSRAGTKGETGQKRNDLFNSLSTGWDYVQGMPTACLLTVEQIAIEVARREQILKNIQAGNFEGFDSINLEKFVTNSTDEENAKTKKTKVESKSQALAWLKIYTTSKLKQKDGEADKAFLERQVHSKREVVRPSHALNTGFRRHSLIPALLVVGSPIESLNYRIMTFNTPVARIKNNLLENTMRDLGALRPTDYQLFLGCNELIEAGARESELYPQLVTRAIAQKFVRLARILLKWNLGLDMVEAMDLKKFGYENLKPVLATANSAEDAINQLNIIQTKGRNANTEKPLNKKGLSDLSEMQANEDIKALVEGIASGKAELQNKNIYILVGQLINKIGVQELQVELEKINK